jgi:ABC-type oligopeptide transport system ATPase subunit
MKNGKLVEQGIAEEVYQNPQTSYTQELINAIPMVESIMV